MDRTCLAGIALLGWIAFTSPALSQGNATSARLREALGARVEDARLGLAGEAARLSGLADAMQAAPPSVAARALSNAQQRSAALRSLAPPATDAAGRVSDAAVAASIDSLRKASAALSADANALAGPAERAPTSSLRDTQRALSAIQLSPSSQIVFNPARGIPFTQGAAGTGGGRQDVSVAGPAGAFPLDIKPFIVGPGGQATNDIPSLGGLVQHDAGGRAFIFCSGTLVAPNAVLTAKHCVDGSQQGLTPRSVFFQHAGNHLVSKTIPFAEHPGMNKIGVDLAIVFLDVPVRGVLPAQITSAGPLPPGTKTVGAGFGFRSGPKGPMIKETGIKVQGFIDTGTCAPSIAAWNLICWRFEPSSAQKTVASTCHADSGGPLFRADTGHLVGVTWAGEEGCAAGSSAFDTDLAPYAKWIRQQLAKHPAPQVPAWADPLDPFANAGRYIVPQSTANIYLDEEGGLASDPFDLPPGLAVLRVIVNASGDPHHPEKGALDELTVTGPSGQPCRQQRKSVFLTCEVSEPAAGPWSLEVSGKAGIETQITVVTFKTLQ